MPSEVIAVACIVQSPAIVSGRPSASGRTATPSPVSGTGWMIVPMFESLGGAVNTISRAESPLSGANTSTSRPWMPARADVSLTVTSKSRSGTSIVRLIA